jgi:transposase-like protein
MPVGVSARKVDRLAGQLGIAGISKERVSAPVGALDEQVRAGELYWGFGGGVPVR